MKLIASSDGIICTTVSLNTAQGPSERQSREKGRDDARQ